MARYPGFSYQNQMKTPEYILNMPVYTLFPQPNVQNTWTGEYSFRPETPGRFPRAPGETFSQGLQQVQRNPEPSPAIGTPSLNDITSHFMNQANNLPMNQRAGLYSGAPLYHTPRIRSIGGSSGFGGRQQNRPPSEEFGSLPPYPGRNSGLIQFPTPNTSTPNPNLQPSPNPSTSNSRYETSNSTDPTPCPPRPPRNNLRSNLVGAEEVPESSTSNNLPYSHHQPKFSIPNPRYKLITPLELSTFGMFRMKFCMAICWCSFQPGGGHYEPFAVSSEPGLHAEIKALDMVRLREGQSGQKVRKVVLICSISPCNRCATYIIDFVRRRGCYFEMWFTKLFKHTEEEQIKGLQELSYFVSMSVSNFHVWSYLIECTNFSASPTHLKLNPEECYAWDILWSSQLLAILQGKRHRLKKMHQMSYLRDEMMKNPVSSYFIIVWYKLIFNVIFAKLL